MPTVNLDDEKEIERELIYRHSPAGRAERRRRRWRMKSHKTYVKIGLIAGTAVGAVAGLLALLAVLYA